MLSATQTISGLAPKTVQYDYDAAGNRQQVIYPSGRTLDYTYDGINRLTDIEQNSVSLAHFDYDLLNRRTLKSFPSTPSLESAYSYYFDNRLEELVNRINGGGVISQNQYTYDNVGNRLSHMSLAQSFTYGYNDIYELTSVSGSARRTVIFMIMWATAPRLMV